MRPRQVFFCCLTRHRVLGCALWHVRQTWSRRHWLKLQEPWLKLLQMAAPPSVCTGRPNLSAWDVCWVAGRPGAALEVEGSSNGRVLVVELVVLAHQVAV